MEILKFVLILIENGTEVNIVQVILDRDSDPESQTRTQIRVTLAVTRHH